MTYKLKRLAEAGGGQVGEEGGIKCGQGHLKMSFGTYDGMFGTQHIDWSMVGVFTKVPGVTLPNLVDDCTLG